MIVRGNTGSVEVDVVDVVVSEAVVGAEVVVDVDVEAVVVVESDVATVTGVDVAGASVAVDDVATAAATEDVPPDAGSASVAPAPEQAAAPTSVTSANRRIRRASQVGTQCHASAPAAPYGGGHVTVARSR